MARPFADEPKWMTEAVELMVRSGFTLERACGELKVPMTTKEAETIQRRKSFQNLLRAARHRYHQEIGADPQLTKAALVGRLLVLADKLIEAEDYDKASEVLFKIAKIRGDVGADAQVNVFADLSASDYAEIRKNLEGDVKIPHGRLN